MFLAVRKHQAHPPGLGRLLADIRAYQAIAVVIGGQLAEHLAVLAHRVVVGFEGGWPEDHLGLQDLPAADEIVFWHLVMQIAEMPEDELGKHVPAIRGGRQTQHELGVKFRHGLGKGPARRAVAFIDDQVADMGYNLRSRSTSGAV